MKSPETSLRVQISLWTLMFDCRKIRHFQEEYNFTNSKSSWTRPTNLLLDPGIPQSDRLQTSTKSIQTYSQSESKRSKTVTERWPKSTTIILLVVTPVHICQPDWSNCPLPDTTRDPPTCIWFVFTQISFSSDTQHWTTISSLVISWHPKRNPLDQHPTSNRLQCRWPGRLTPPSSYYRVHPI